MCNPHADGDTPTKASMVGRRRLILDFLPALAHWIDPATGEMKDPYETHYAEGYAPGTSAVLFARGYIWSGEPRWFELAVSAIDRSLDIVASQLPHNNALIHLFGVYYAHYALHLLAGDLDDLEYARLRERFVRTTPSYYHNLNGLLMSVLHRINLDTLGHAACDWHSLAPYLAEIQRQQTAHGFVNDDLRGNSCPIAYHLYSCVVTWQSLALRSRFADKWNDAHFQRARQVLVGLIERENGWTTQFTGADGSLAMAERSRDHFWTAGAYVAYCLERGVPEEHPLVQDHLRYWLSYTRCGGDTPITPTAFAGAYRVGFEDYATMLMYSTLGFALMALAEGDFLPNRAILPVTPDPTALPTGLFTDSESGYAHWRAGRSSLGVSLAARESSKWGGYTLAGGLFNVCLNRQHHRIIANSAAFPVAYQLTNRRTCINSEGFMAIGADNRPIWPKPERATTAEMDEGVLRIEWHQPDMSVRRLLRLGDAGVESRWDIRANRPLKTVEFTVPLVIDDGSGLRRLDVHKNAARVTLPDGQEYRLETSGEWELDLGTSTESTNGVTRSLRIRVPTSLISEGASASVGWLLRRISSGGKDVESVRAGTATFSADDVSAWTVKFGEESWVSFREGWVYYEVPDGKKVYIVSGGDMADFRTPPSHPHDRMLRCGLLYSLRLDTEYQPRDVGSQVNIAWLNYGAGGPGKTVLYSFFSGVNCIPVSSQIDSPGFRIAFRLVGAGRLLVKRLAIVPFDVCYAGGSRNARYIE
ncbi:MAG: hypothetical protein JXQ75_00480 [Phycisphaerae bacterium]|nr:hypothetical protein [Phycisphaerae bacterium]